MAAETTSFPSCLRAQCWIAAGLQSLVRVGTDQLRRCVPFTRAENRPLGMCCAILQSQASLSAARGQAQPALANEGYLRPSTFSPKAWAPETPTWQLGRVRIRSCSAKALTSLRSAAVTAVKRRRWRRDAAGSESHVPSVFSGQADAPPAQPSRPAPQGQGRRRPKEAGVQV